MADCNTSCTIGSGREGAHWQPTRLHRYSLYPVDLVDDVVVHHLGRSCQPVLTCKAEVHAHASVIRCQKVTMLHWMHCCVPPTRCVMLACGMPACLTVCHALPKAMMIMLRWVPPFEPIMEMQDDRARTVQGSHSRHP